MRYDTKMNAFDWDLHMRLHSIGANQICSQEYKQFRNNGLAFTWLESEVSKSNRSLVCGVIPNGEKFVHCGYLGDIQTGNDIYTSLQLFYFHFTLSPPGQEALNKLTHTLGEILRQARTPPSFGGTL